MSIDVIEVELSQREVQLLLKYAYPFDHEQAQLDSVGAKAGYHLLQDGHNLGVNSRFGIVC